MIVRFWLYDPMDFCKDLKTWTTALLEDPACPLVHSISYGWQGDLSELGGCGTAVVGSIDADFAKLAAKDGRVSDSRARHACARARVHARVRARVRAWMCVPSLYTSQTLCLSIPGT